jgi:prepilin-type N-terminal cleavage/methylation domain-containing protein
VRRDGLTLLETMVALVILGLVVVGYLEVFGTSLRAAQNATDWSHAVTYAEQGMELAKLDLQAALLRGPESLEGDFRRQIETRSWSDDLLLVTVTITFPDGGRFALNRLLETSP